MTEDRAEEVEVVVAVGDDALDHLDEVVEGLTSQGLAVTGVQSTLRTVSGRLARSAVAGLAAVAASRPSSRARTTIC